MATIKDVAEKAEVSVATVSAVVNRDSDVNVSQELTRKVEQAVAELNYHPNRIARALSRKKTSTIAYIIPSISNQFFSDLTEIIEERSFDRGYGVYICNTGGSEKRIRLYLNNLIESRVDGVIVTLIWPILEYKFVQKLLAADIPVVGLAGAREVQTIDTVTIADKQGGSLAAEYLWKTGYYSIGFIGVEQSRTTEKRLSGINAYLYPENRDNNSSNNSCHVKLGSDFSRREGYNLMKQLLAETSELDAVIVYNDVMATGVLDYLAEKKMKIPQEMAVLGFDDSVACYTRPQLSTMALNRKKLAVRAVEMLFERIAEKTGQVRHEKLVPRLIERETT